MHRHGHVKKPKSAPLKTDFINELNRVIYYNNIDTSSFKFTELASKKEGGSIKLDESINTYGVLKLLFDDAAFISLLSRYLMLDTNIENIRKLIEKFQPKTFHSSAINQLSMLDAEIQPTAIIVLSDDINLYKEKYTECLIYDEKTCNSLTKSDGVLLVANLTGDTLIPYLGKCEWLFIRDYTEYSPLYKNIYEILHDKKINSLPVSYTSKFKQIGQIYNKLDPIKNPLGLFTQLYHCD